MAPEKLAENIVEIAKNAAPKIPHKWANIQVVSIKTPESVALPVYNKTPEALKELAKLAGLEEDIETPENEASDDNKDSPFLENEASTNCTCLRWRPALPADQHGAGAHRKRWFNGSQVH